MGDLNKVNREFRMGFEKIKRGRSIVGFRFLCVALPSAQPCPPAGSSAALPTSADAEELDGEAAFFARHAGELAAIESGCTEGLAGLDGFALMVKSRLALVSMHQEEWDRIHRPGR